MPRNALSDSFLSIVHLTENAHGPETALGEAVRYSLPSEVDRLISIGTDVNARLKKGLRPLMFANRVGIAKALIAAGADINSTDDMGRTPLIWFCLGSYPRKNTDAYIRYLLDAGANVNSTDTDGRTAYEYAQGKCSADVLDLLRPNRRI